MGYLGNTPALNFISFAKQVFTIVNSQTAYTLDHKVTNENDIRLVINNVVQEPGSGKAYTASGNTLTLSSALVNGTDEMYCVFLGKAVQTVNAPNASVGSDQTASTIITGQTAETSIADSDTILIHDDSASALRKMTKANFVSGVGGANTPAFFATSIISEDNTAISNDTFTKLTMDTEVFDTDNTYSSDRFTPGVAGKYLITAKASATNVVNSATVALAIYKNGSIMEAVHYSNYGTYTSYFNDLGNANAGYYTMALNVLVDANSTDYFELYGRHNIGGNSGGLVDKYFGAFKLIGA